jgi:peptidoglycan/xylan/chitin deacetylase (PgdA/CDA1 family)
MGRRLSIVMYHYVRELKRSRYPEIRGLSIDLFKEQLKYIVKHYQVVAMEDLIASVKSGRPLPPKALLLTFDDAYADHFQNVFPVLDELKLEGSFFPPAKAILEHRVLDVNKIHFILASACDKLRLIEDIYSMLDEFRLEYALKENRYYFQKLAIADRFDSKEIIFIKRILQRELPEKVRGEIVERLFKKYVNVDEEVFARELYMSVDQLKCLKRNGMYIGSHGFHHSWLNTLDSCAQETEIDLSLEFLRQIGCVAEDWVMCYPYGAHDDTLLSILKRRGCIIGLTTEPGIADLDTANPLTLPRLDTNDLPKDRQAPSPWTAGT